MTQIFFEVFTPLPTLNKLLRMHWAVKKRLQDQINTEIAVIVNAMVTSTGEIPPEFLGMKKKRVLIITLYRKKLQDPDNLVGSCKPLIDAVKKTGLIYDDSDTWVKLDIRQLIAGQEKCFVEVRG